TDNLRRAGMGLCRRTAKALDGTGGEMSIGTYSFHQKASSPGQSGRSTGCGTCNEEAGTGEDRSWVGSFAQATGVCILASSIWREATYPQGPLASGGFRKVPQACSRERRRAVASLEGASSKLPFMVRAAPRQFNQIFPNLRVAGS